MLEFYEPETLWAWCPVRTQDGGWTWGAYIWRVRWTIDGAAFYRYYRHRRNVPSEQARALLGGAK